MLHARNNRLDYGQLLQPPDGYQLIKAVGTTYSLDLNALMILPVAMFYSESTDRPKGELRVDMVDAVVNAADKIDVYYQEGKLQVPKKYHHLMAFWEKGLHAIRMPIAAASFHPKVWICRFEATNKATKYRLVIMSRNLTFASDYDIAFASEGEVGNNVNHHNQPLIHFLRYLSKKGGTISEEFISDLEKVAFDNPDKFEDLRFHPIGVPLLSNKYKHPIHEYSWQELLIISPFIDDKTVTELDEATEKPLLLLSTQEELSYLKKELLSKVKPWQFSRFIETNSGREEVTENEEDPLPQSLHAKLFVALSHNQPYWYLGSANCTAPAQDRNIEFLIELKATGRGCKPNDLLQLLTSTTEEAALPLFESFQPCQVEELEKKKGIDRQIRLILYNLFATPVQAVVERNEQTNLYTYLIELNLTHFKLPDNFLVSIRPISDADEIPVALIQEQYQIINTFKNYAETQLTPYFVVAVYYQGRKESESIWCLPIELPETRLNRIFTAIIHSRERFMDYLFFLLNGEQAAILEGNEGPGKKAGVHNANLFDGKPLFEHLLIAASRDMGKLKSIKEVVMKLSVEDTDKPDEQRILSQAFLQFWDIFDQYLTLKHAG